jgi:threonine synthase
VGLLTGNVLKDPEYIYRYHTGQLKTESGEEIRSTFGNQPRVVENSADAIVRMLKEL